MRNSLAMPSKIRWGILGAAGIALKLVIPAMKKSNSLEIAAIASRDPAKARMASESLGIPRAYGSYEELLADPDLDAIYNPLPNHLHVPWTVKAAEAGKHVLCEKPIAMNPAETRTLIEVRDRTGVTIAEAFMVRTHPQWLRTRELIRSGQLGELKFITGKFSYFNKAAENIRNIKEYGGGGLMDIGCYPVTMSRFLFEREPKRVLGLFEFDPEWGTDRLSSGILDFDGGQAIFGCSTQLVPAQSFEALCTSGRIEIGIPFNTPASQPAFIKIDDGSQLGGASARTESFEPSDQYQLQGEAFAAAIQGKAPVPVSLEDAFANMAVISALFKSSQTGKWEEPERLI
jgi:predicted dehydrogenase